MFFYFKLQFKLLSRHISDFGIHPWIGYLIFIACFTGFSYYIFPATEFAEYIYMLLPLSFIFNFSEANRNIFLKSIFPGKRYYRIRLLENSLIILPFLIVLLMHQEYIPVISLMLIAFLLSFLTLHNTMNYILPTPFYKEPFEFIVGFRNTFYLFFIAWSLTLIAVLTGNFNLGIFALLLVILITLSYYSKPEKEYFVWIYRQSPGGFLLRKIKMALLFSTLLCLPVTIPLFIFFFKEAVVIFGFQILSYFYIVTIVLAKYSRFPEQINLPEVGILALSIWFPPMLIAIIPFFYSRSVTKLQKILG